MILGVIPRCIVVLLLTAVMAAQDVRAPRVRIIFPEGVQSNRASMTYLRYGPTGGHASAGVSGASKGSPFEIPMEKGERFKEQLFGRRDAKFEHSMSESKLRTSGFSLCVIR